ncbi:hypothetical protein BD289DRAFT_79241 [Coniella lustricola]|uniref:T6SS Phospholipase effector Tle1-like catalytic domain-containing protein n=1 Tax=Coniella lustricola TaxID=2025994 RepID=A0A2T2ZZ65_9PEZI|nr:hypothetical protein BD289DRAFT_79241 [Coniella lustricola]
MASPSSKRLIVCCDGSWMNALGKQGVSSPPSNVWRICRLFKNVCDDGTNQIVYYHAGVGSSGSKLDSITGGDFGVGLDMDICQLYTFISINYVDGDAIILVGFSRGAFTVRAVADMIASLGLMTHSGLDRFYDIFTDYQLMGSKERKVDDFLCKDVLQPYAGQEGTDKILWEEERKRVYREFLKDNGYTRDRHQDGVTKIKIKAVAVWDTVGDLGIPPVPMLGVRGSVAQWRFTNSNVAREVENAFHALALDEPRAAFRPTLWERIHDHETNLKQVWFPGTHANVGGGYYDQQMADITLAWMCDQLASVSVEFNLSAMRALFEASRAWSAAHPFPWVPCPTHSAVPTSSSSSSSSSHFHISLPPIFHHFSSEKQTGTCSCESSSSAPLPLPWANSDIFPTALLANTPRDTKDTPLSPSPSSSVLNLTASSVTTTTTTTTAAATATARPYALGQLRAPTSTLQHALGTITRHPASFHRIDEATNVPIPSEPLRNTGEAVHASVRVRLACGGLGLDDAGVWKCPGLSTAAGGDGGGGDDGREIEDGNGGWRLVRSDDDDGDGDEEEEGEKSWGCQHTWRWEKAQGEPDTVRILPEEPLHGVCEKMLLEVSKGEAVDVWAYADEHALKVLATE